MKIPKTIKIKKSKKHTNSEYISNYGLYLPSFVGLKKKDLDRIITILNKVVSS